MSPRIHLNCLNRSTFLSQRTCWSLNDHFWMGKIYPIPSASWIPGGLMKVNWFYNIAPSTALSICGIISHSTESIDSWTQHLADKQKRSWFSRISFRSILQPYYKIITTHLVLSSYIFIRTLLYYMVSQHKANTLDKVYSFFAYTVLNSMCLMQWIYYRNIILINELFSLLFWSG